MSKRKPKYYVVWHGAEPGVYRNWPDCERQVKGFVGARYKSYATAEEAEAAFASAPPARRPAAPPHRDRSRPAGPPDWRHDTVLPLPPEVKADAWAVDAACSGNPGKMEYRGVCLKTGQEIFHFGPVYGTNNIGEFLAIVHALALLKREGATRTVYSDSRNALLWVKGGKCKTRLPHTPRTAELYDLIGRAERWLANNDWSDIPLHKWETGRWGEVPADFGRK